MRNVCVSVGRLVCVTVFRFLSLSHSLFPSRSVLLSFFLICKHMCALWLKLEVFRCFVCILFSFSANCTHEDGAFPFNFQQFFFYSSLLVAVYIYETHGNVCNATIIFTFAAICNFFPLCVHCFFFFIAITWTHNICIYAWCTPEPICMIFTGCENFIESFSCIHVFQIGPVHILIVDLAIKWHSIAKAHASSMKRCLPAAPHQINQSLVLSTERRSNSLNWPI